MKGSQPPEEASLTEEEVGGVPETMDTRRQAAQRHYAELDFSEKRPVPAPESDMFVVVYSLVSQA